MTFKSRIIYGLLGDATQRPPVPKWKLFSEVRRASSRFLSPMRNAEQSQRGNPFRKLAEHYLNVSLPRWEKATEKWCIIYFFYSTS